jgi:hypothetical protein
MAASRVANPTATTTVHNKVPSSNLPAASRSNMQPIAPSSGIDRRVLLSTLALLPALSGPLFPVFALAQTATPGGGLLPSWNDGPAKQAIFDLVRATINRSSPSYVFPEDRIAVFDQDGTPSADRA